MASIYPSFEVIKRLKVQPTAGEKKLLKLLYNSLDDRFDIYFQPYLRGDRPDIILLNKEAGLLILKIINPTFMENANIIVPSWVPKNDLPF